MRKQSKKIEKRTSGLVSWEGVGGLAEAAGKVRKGNPSRTGRLNASIQNHASTPLGYAEFKSLREIAVPREDPDECFPELMAFPGKFPAWYHFLVFTLQNMAGYRPQK